MPARTRSIGPEVSNQVAAAMKEALDQKGWTRVRLSQEMAARGDRMSAATLAHIEKGTWMAGKASARLISVDEAAALIRALGQEFMQDVITIIRGTDETP